MKSTELAKNFKILVKELELENLNKIIFNYFLFQYKNTSPISPESRKSFVKIMLNINRVLFAYSTRADFNEIIKNFKLDETFNEDIITKMIGFSQNIGSSGDIFKNHEILTDFNKILNSANFFTTASKALNKFLIEEKQIKLNDDEGEMQFIIPNNENGHTVSEIIEILNTLNRIYENIKKFYESDEELKIEYFDSGSAILVALVGFLPAISKFLDIAQKWDNLKQGRIRNKVENIKNYFELEELFEKKIQEGKLTKEEADKAIDDIVNDMNLMFDIGIKSNKQSDIFETKMLRDVPEQKLLPDSEN